MDAVTGVTLWQTEPAAMGPSDQVRLSLDRSGNFLDVRYFDEGKHRLTYDVMLETSSQKFLGAAHGENRNTGWSTTFPYRVDVEPTHDSNYRLILLPKGKDQTILALGIDHWPTGHGHTWNSEGSRYAWGQADGVVHVADCNEIQRQLTAVGLGW